jgi:hypothetical protein
VTSASDKPSTEQLQPINVIPLLIHRVTSHENGDSEGRTNLAPYSLREAVPPWRFLLTLADISVNQSVGHLGVLSDPTSGIPFSMSWISIIWLSLVSSITVHGQANWDPKSGQGPDPLANFCRRWGHATGLVDHKLYIDGGYVNYGPFTQSSQNLTSKQLHNVSLKAL